MEQRTTVTGPVAKQIGAPKDLGHRLGGKRSRKGRPDPLGRVTTLVLLGRHEAAITAAEELLQTDPDNLAALEVLAKMQWQTCKMQAVVETTRRLVILNPYEPGYHVLQASALQCLGRYGEAARAYQRANHAPGVDDAVADLNSWQAGLVADMLTADLVFRAHYAQNPSAACAARGFSFLSDPQTPERWLVGSERRESLFVRPS